MRLWSLHPSYLDQKGLVAVWREGLLALHVLSNKTIGYKNHPQLLRFKEHVTPLPAISTYLHYIVDEAEKRGYQFKREKLFSFESVAALPVTTGQLAYEVSHLKEKLRMRNEKKYMEILKQSNFLPHPLFSITEGPVADWEKVVK